MPSSSGRCGGGRESPSEVVPASRMLGCAFCAVAPKTVTCIYRGKEGSVSFVPVLEGLNAYGQHAVKTGG